MLSEKELQLVLDVLLIDNAKSMADSIPDQKKNREKCIKRIQKLLEKNVTPLPVWPYPPEKKPKKEKR